MKPETSASATPATSGPAGDSAAVAYIAQELPKARKALRRARVVGLVLLGLVGGYFTVISVTLVRFFQPQAAAQVASGMVLEHVANDGPALAVELERQIPLLIRQAPDYVIRQMPAYRQQAELVVETELQGHCENLAKEVGKQMDDLIATHASELRTLLDHPNDRAGKVKVLLFVEPGHLRSLSADQGAAILAACESHAFDDLCGLGGV